MSRYDLAGKVVLITGGAQGIGFETAQIAYRRGAAVALVDLDEKQAVEAAGIDRSAGDRHRSERGRRGADRSRRRAGRETSSAGSTWSSPTPASPRRRRRPARSPTEDWERVVDVNVLGVWRTVRAGLDAGDRERGPDRDHLFQRRPRERHDEQLLRGLEGGGRSTRPGASAANSRRTVRAPRSPTSVTSRPD